MNHPLAAFLLLAGTIVPGHPLIAQAKNAGNPENDPPPNITRLTGFERVPDDFGKVLAQTRKTYPPTTVPAAPAVKKD